MEYASLVISVGSLALSMFAILWKRKEFCIKRKDEHNWHEEEHRWRELDAFHSKIKELVEPDGSGSTWIERQIAAVNELRSFEHHFPVIYRILSGLQEEWTSEKEKVNDEEREKTYKRLLDEIDRTLNYIKAKGTDE